MRNWYIVFDVITNTLNNTFVGTFSAGALLAFLGIRLYKQQKKIDLHYEEERRVRKLASDLFANVDVAANHFQSQWNVYGGNLPQIKKLWDEANQKYDNHFSNKFSQEANDTTKNINDASSELLAMLKLKKWDENILSQVSTDVGIFNLFIVTTWAFPKQSKENLNELKREFDKTLERIKAFLRGVIDA